MTTTHHRTSNNNRTRRRPSCSQTAVIAWRQRSTAVVLRLLLLLVVLAATATTTNSTGTSSIIHRPQAEEEEEARIALHPHDDEGNETPISDNEDNGNKSLASSYQRHDSISSSTNATTTVTSSSSSSSHRQLLSVDPKVRERFLADPPGYRKHPSYYSETYLRRASSDVLTEAANRMELQQQWGHWTFVDRKRTMRPGNEFYAQYPHRDVPLVDFPAEAWQRNADYVQKFLNQATDLTMRAMEAILTEYVHGPPLPPTSSAADTTATYPRADFVQRSAAFQVDKTNSGVLDKNKDSKTTGGWIPQESWNGLKRRLLHAIMTEDSFHLVMGGHSSAAGHGNHFQQSYTLQYGKIMEPIFARLGVKATASNMGMGGLGTMHNAIGAGSIYGRQVDILVWDSGMTEASLVDQGIFATQGLLGSARAPFLWFERISCLHQLFTEMNVDVGVYGNGRAILKEAESFEALVQQPWAARYMACNSEISHECKEEYHQYNGTCWIDRSTTTTSGTSSSTPQWRDSGIELQEFTPVTAQKPEPGGRASWHPGNHVHQLQGRTMAFVVLLALHEALMDWKRAENYQLPDEAWHVTAYYKNIHEKVAASALTDSWCEQKNLPMAICRVAMTARTENTPRARPWETSIRSLIKASGNVPVSAPNLYDPPDVYNPKLHPPPGEIDVLAIIENGVDFAPNLARIRDSSQKMSFQPPLSGNSMNPAIVPGKGWSLTSVGSDNCDGMYDSHCSRGDDNSCLLYAHNDGRNAIMFDSLSGWMVFNIPKIEHGIIILGIYDWVSDNPVTRGWCTENDEGPCSGRNLRAQHDDSAEHAMISNSTHGGTKEENVLDVFAPDKQRQEQQQHQLLRHLKKSSVPPYCDEFQFEYAINGQIETLDLATWNSMQNHVERVVQLWTIKDDSSFTGENVEFALRMRGCVKQPRKAFALSHIYWA